MKDSEFKKATKKEKLEMDENFIVGEEKFTKVLFLPIRRQMDNWKMCATFGLRNGVWKRLEDYDCFCIFNEKTSLRGDFEYGGVVFFTGDNATLSYGNGIKIKQNSK